MSSKWTIKQLLPSPGFRQIPVTDTEVLRNRWQDISFSSAIAAGAGLGRVEIVADSNVAYTNGVETMVWGLSPAENDDLRGLKSNDL